VTNNCSGEPCGAVEKTAVDTTGAATILST